MTTDTRTALLDAAEQAVRSRGFDGFSYADLSEAVGIRKASIHYHFPTKADLAAELLARYAARVTDRLAEIAAGAGRGADRLAAAIAIYRQALGGGDMTCLCVALTVAFDSIPSEVTRRMATFRQDVTSWLEAAYRLGRADGSIRAVADPAPSRHLSVLCRPSSPLGDPPPRKASRRLSGGGVGDRCWRTRGRGTRRAGRAMFCEFGSRMFTQVINPWADWRKSGV